MPATQLGSHKLDARPDRTDLRDRMYQPRLVSLPEQFPLPSFIEANFATYSKRFVLDQGPDGACTGFGLAAVINYLLWKRSLDLQPMTAPATGRAKGRRAAAVAPAPVCVSPWMLYKLARMYDEWAGDDYEGSSCRGAVKGWHRHGVCRNEIWSDRNTNFLTPEKAGDVAARARSALQDAALRPLGAYYRIDKDSIADMHSAINEVGAIYVSAEVHEGWEPLLKGTKTLAQIQPRPPQSESGVHAFALIGYTTDGFIVQNSWGTKWGYHGFAILPYDDWTNHGVDAWVAVMGAPMRVRDAVATRSDMNLAERESGAAKWFWNSESSKSRPRYMNPAVEPLDEDAARHLTVVMGNNGRPINDHLFAPTTADALDKVLIHEPAAWLKANKANRVALYAHGGLNDEAASIKRIRVMAPYFLANGIYPLFFTWKTGVLESITGRLEDAIQHLVAEPQRAGLRIFESIAEARDRAIEAGSERVLVKGLWSEMKQNAVAASEMGGGLFETAKRLALLQTQMPGLKLHAIGHSAGSILLGALAPALEARKVALESCTLYAAACTVDFAGSYYVPALRSGTIRSMTVHHMSDARELDDTVGPYGKSLLYLVSRALEVAHKTPLLGMANAWSPETQTEEFWNSAMLAGVRSTISQLRALGVKERSHDERLVAIKTYPSVKEQPIAHGSFDNDVNVLTATLAEILGRKTIPAAVENLEGF